MKYGTLLSELSTIESLADVKADRDRLLKANKEMTENLAKYEKKLKEFPLQEIKIDQGAPGAPGGLKAVNTIADELADAIKALLGNSMPGTSGYDSAIREAKAALANYTGGAESSVKAAATAYADSLAKLAAGPVSDKLQHVVREVGTSVYHGPFDTPELAEEQRAHMAKSYPEKKFEVTTRKDGVMAAGERQLCDFGTCKKPAKLAVQTTNMNSADKEKRSFKLCQDHHSSLLDTCHRDGLLVNSSRLNAAQAELEAKRYKLKAGTPEIGKTYEEEGMGEESIDFRVVDKGTGKEMAEKYPKAWEECKTHMSYDQWPGFLKSPVCVVLYEGFGKDDLSIVSEAYVTDCEETDGFGASVQGAAGPHGSARVREIYTQLSTAQSKLQDCALLADEVRESGLCDDVAVDMITAAIHSMADSVLPIWKKLFEYHSGPSRENLGASVKAGGQCGETEFIKNHGGKWVILDSKTGKVLSHHDSCEAAHEAMKALQFHKHGGS